MPPTTVHFNGSINLPDAETVFREVCRRVPQGLRRLPDGETGDRNNWILFQLARFQRTPGLESGTDHDPLKGYDALPQVRLADGVRPEEIAWPNLGYADAYLESFQLFDRLQADGTIPNGVRFQVQYPTPTASAVTWLAPEHRAALEPGYAAALFADLQRLLAALPHDRIAVQWDVAVEFALLSGGVPAAEDQGFEAIVERLATCVDQVPADIPVGLHLCYGDYGHRHFAEPESLALQVAVANRLASDAHRRVDFLAFTVPQYQRDPAYFAPLAELRVDDATELAFALVPYHPEQQEAGTTDTQVQLIDNLLAGRPWAICTECGMGRVERDDVPRLLDRYAQIAAEHGSGPRQRASATAAGARVG